MSVNKTADRLFQYLTRPAPGFRRLRNGRGLIIVALASALICAVFGIRYRDSLSRAGRLTLIVSILTSTALAVIAWKGCS